MKNIVLAIFVGLFVASFADAHPGQVNEQGCHRNTKEWKYKSGKVLNAGTEHCHRGLGKMRFDGKELIENPSDRGSEVKTKRKAK